MPRLMGILNVNADSFSDPRDVAAGGKDVDRMTLRGTELRGDGADIVDVGAESASPATPVIDASAEIDALLPVLEGLHAAGVRTSVDTYKPAVAAACVKAGTSLINDYSGLASPELAEICADGNACLVLTHNPAGVKNKLLDPDGYRNVVDEVAAWFEAKLAEIDALGLPEERVWLDPGIDLSKTPAQSIELLRGLGMLARFDLPLLVAVSRKDFIGALSPSRPAHRDPGTLAAIGQLIGIPKTVARVHDVAAAAQYLRVSAALSGQRPLDPQLALPRKLRREEAGNHSVPLR